MSLWHNWVNYLWAKLKLKSPDPALKSHEKPSPLSPQTSHFLSSLEINKNLPAKPPGKIDGRKREFLLSINRIMAHKRGEKKHLQRRATDWQSDGSSPSKGKSSKKPRT